MSDTAGCKGLRRTSEGGPRCGGGSLGRQVGAGSLRRAPLPYSFSGREYNRAAVHGVIFASFVDYMAARHGYDVVSEIFSDQPVFLLSQSYEDERLLALINRASELTGTPEGELVYQVGAFTAEQTFARLYPAFFAAAGGSRAFLLSVETFIHEHQTDCMLRDDPPACSRSGSAPGCSPPEHPSVADPPRDAVRVEALEQELCRPPSRSEQIAKTRERNRPFPLALLDQEPPGLPVRAGSDGQAVSDSH